VLVGAIRDYIARLGYASGVRLAGLIAGVLPLAPACALTVSYDGYDETSSSADASSGAGGSSGIGGWTFGGGPSGGGTSGVDGSTGGVTGGVGGASGNGGSGGSACTGDGECPLDEPCIDWKCQGNQCVENKLSGVPCGPNVCGDTTQVTISSCDLGVCNKTEMSCAPYVCEGTNCLTSCTDINDCVGGLICNGNSCQQCLTCSEKFATPSSSLAFCPTSQNNWTDLVSCCVGTCSAECGSFAVCGGVGPADTLCTDCLLQSSACDLEYYLCVGDT
jgi:hypothetical protein